MGRIPEYRRKALISSRPNIRMATDAGVGAMYNQMAQSAKQTANANLDAGYTLANAEIKKGAEKAQNINMGVGLANSALNTYNTIQTQRAQQAKVKAKQEAAKAKIELEAHKEQDKSVMASYKASYSEGVAGLKQISGTNYRDYEKRYEKMIASLDEQYKDAVVGTTSGALERWKRGKEAEKNIYMNSMMVKQVITAHNETVEKRIQGVAAITSFNELIQEVSNPSHLTSSIISNSPKKTFNEENTRVVNAWFDDKAVTQPEKVLRMLADGASFSELEKRDVFISAKRKEAIKSVATRKVNQNRELAETNAVHESFNNSGAFIAAATKDDSTITVGALSARIEDLALVMKVEELTPLQKRAALSQIKILQHLKDARLSSEAVHDVSETTANIYKDEIHTIMKKMVAGEDEQGKFSSGEVLFSRLESSEKIAKWYAEKKIDSKTFLAMNKAVKSSAIVEMSRVMLGEGSQMTRFEWVASAFTTEERLLSTNLKKINDFIQKTPALKDSPRDAVDFYNEVMSAHNNSHIAVLEDGMVKADYSNWAQEREKKINSIVKSLKVNTLKQHYPNLFMVDNKDTAYVEDRNSGKKGVFYKKTGDVIWL